MRDVVDALLVVIELADDAKSNSIDLAAMREWYVRKLPQRGMTREDEVVVFPKHSGTFDKICFAGGEQPDRNLVATAFLPNRDVVRLELAKGVDYWVISSQSILHDLQLNLDGENRKNGMVAGLRY